eukprot:2564548-Rhodomonas_salina.1
MPYRVPLNTGVPMLSQVPRVPGEPGTRVPRHPGGLTRGFPGSTSTTASTGPCGLERTMCIQITSVPVGELEIPAVAPGTDTITTSTNPSHPGYLGTRGTGYPRVPRVHVTVYPV